jgi:hypothetical protein
VPDDLVDNYEIEVSELTKHGHEKLSEEKVYGRIPTRTLQKRWNEMVIALSKKDAFQFMEISEKVQSLLSIFIEDENLLSKVERRIEASRYILLEMGNPRMARKSLKRAKILLRDSSVHISPLV